MPSRPLLTAHWSELLLLNWAVPTEVVMPLVPPGTEPDLHDGQAYISVVGFRFPTCRLLGIPIPGHTSFPEINLRFYVRRHAGDELRRGVVFVREIVPRRAVALIANWLYNENYVTRRMRTNLNMSGASLALGDTIEYAWRSNGSWPLRGRPDTGQLQDGWNRLAARVAAPPAIPAANSLDEFLVEHYWGYVHGRDDITREYRVTHDPWMVALADDVIWDCDVPLTYSTPLAKYLSSPPTTALIAAGSPIHLYRGQRLVS
jgi:uncharacterized protein